MPWQIQPQSSANAGAARNAWRDENTNEIIGYYTLSSYGFPIEDIPGSLAKKLPKYPIVPATMIGRLAICSKLAKSGWGSFILIDALKRSYDNSRKIASFAVVVDAKDQSAMNFYKHFGFTQFIAQQARLFLPMETIRHL